MPARRSLLPTLLALLPATAVAETAMRMLDSAPVARSVMDGNRQEFRVRFSHPVDHNASRLIVLQADRALRTLRPRLGASPDTLYAAAGSLPAGDYALRWLATSARDKSTLQGELPFTVRP